MSEDVMSQTDVESLLSALDTSQDGGTTPAPASTPAPPTRARETVTPYGFKRPQRVGREQMRALQTLHEGFSRNFGAAISALVRNIVEVKLTSVDQLTYSEFVFSLENPTCFNLLKAEPLEGNLILDINPSILNPLIDRLLGGGAEATTMARRPLTEIELRLVSRITRLFLDELRRAWENVLELTLEVTRVESDPHRVQIVPPSEVVVLISFELTLGDIRGMMKLCIPYNSIERISNKLTADSWVSCGQRRATPQSIEQVGRPLAGAQVELVVDLAKSRITTRELIGLRVGDIITTQKDVNAWLDVYLAGQPKFRAHPGAFKGQKAIRVEETLEPPAESEGGT